MAPYKVFITDDTETVRRTATSLTLDDNATVEEMKKALSDAEGFHEERYRILYRKPTHDEALDDDDILTEVVKEDGNFVAEISKLGPFDGTIDLTYEDQSCIGNASILMGSPKDFEHFKLNHDKNNMKLKRGKAREPFKFKWLHNKLAVVEKETDAEYIAYQYFIRNKWSLKVIKQDEGQVPKWILKKKNENGQFITLFGKQKSYPETREKIRRSVMIEAE